MIGGGGGPLALSWRRMFETLKALFQKHRKRLAFVALIVFLVAVAIEVGGAIPREVEVDFPMGEGHAQVTEARIEYWQEDEMVRTVQRHFPQGAPRSVRDSVELSPGDYEVSVLLVRRGGDSEELRGRLSAPSDGVVRIALGGGS